MSIKVENISKYYGAQAALSDVSFQISSGEVVGFIGPNGAGKSTMMKIITCFIPSSEGKTEVCGYDVQEESIAVKKKIGYLPENNPLYHDMFVKEYLNFVAQIHKIDNRKEKVAAMVETVGLTREQNKKIGALSKGYKQRVGLAQAIIHDPEVLILDEPTSGLDPNQLVDIRGLISKIGETKTVMLSTHIMQEVEAICSRAMIIKDGKVVKDDSIQNIQSEDRDKQVIFIEVNKSLSKSFLKKIEGIESVKNISEHEWLIEASSKKDIRPNLVRVFTKKDIDLLTIRKEGRKIEDVFKRMTQ